MKKGFTIVELLIVVAILGILAAIAVPNFLEAQKRAAAKKGGREYVTPEVQIALDGAIKETGNGVYVINLESIDCTDRADVLAKVVAKFRKEHPDVETHITAIQTVSEQAVSRYLMITEPKPPLPAEKN